ncbi:MAG: DOPA 4,5-dioxygenase family protein [Methylophilus sp.]|nr:DOPA 4,5-dioxygenase family protein [Methylophilus sp.]
MQKTSTPLNLHYHAHIYFETEQSALATRVRENIIRDIPQLTYRGQLIPVPVGPHIKPMFELHIPSNSINYAMASMDALREGLSILIHPVQEDEYLAHTADAKWLGPALPLKLEVLKSTPKH